MKTISIPVYTFDELTPAAKERARDWWRSCSTGDELDLSEPIEQGQLLGFTFNERNGSPSVMYSGFACQGDGACFEGTWKADDCQADKVADGWGDSPATEKLKGIAATFGRIAKLYPDASFSVSHSGRYYHEYSTDFDFERFPDDETGDDWPADKQAEYEAATDELKEESRAFMKWIYRQLESDYEWFNSDECVDENILCNDYLFTAEGSRSASL